MAKTVLIISDTKHHETVVAICEAVMLIANTILIEKPEDVPQQLNASQHIIVLCCLKNKRDSESLFLRTMYAALEAGITILPCALTTEATLPAIIGDLRSANFAHCHHAAMSELRNALQKHI
jgi:hypothetical protein